MMLAILLLMTLAAAAPPTGKTEKLIVTDKFYPDSSLLYAGSHDIVDIIVPLNIPNYGSDTIYVNYLFFVEADIKEDGSKDFKGVYNLKNGKVKKVLDNGQSATYSYFKEDKIYLGAKDGIYNYKNETVEKYGSVTESVIKMAVDTKKEEIYYLTADYVLYKFKDGEVESAKVEAVKDARDMVFDYDGNLYFYDGSKQLYAYNGEKVVKIEGLPASPTKVKFVNTLVWVKELFVVVDGSLYIVSPEGTSAKTDVEFQAQPTAFAPDIVLMEYYAYNKKIYEYNLIALIKSTETDVLYKLLTLIDSVTKVKPSKNFEYYVSYDVNYRGILLL